MPRSIAGAVVFAIALLGLGSTTAAQVPIAVSGGPYELTEADGKHTLTITVTNTTGTPLTASLALSTAQSGCDIQADPDEVGANRSVAVKFTLPSVCVLGDEKTDLTLSVGGPDGVVLSAPVAAEAPDEPSTEFGDLNAYWFCAVAVFVVVAAIGGLWKANKLPPKSAANPKRQFRARLPGLAADWSFKDSWTSNVSLAAAIFTGVLGASAVLEDILGKDHEQEVTLAVVSAAISAGLIGAAPIILAIFRKSWSDDDKDRSRNTVIGVLLATHVVLTAAAGQIVVMAVVLIDADVIDDVLTIGLAIAAGLALVAYAVQTVPLTITDGLVKAPTDPSEVEALDRVAAAILKVGGPDSATELAGLDATHPWVSELLATSPGDTEAPRPRSAMP